MAFVCPHCGTIAHTRTSRMLSEQTKETRYRCENDLCGHIFVALEQIVRTVSPPAVPAANVHIPLSLRTAAQAAADGQADLL